MFDESFRARFFAKVTKGESENQCWKWIGAKRGKKRGTKRDGYGIFTIKGQPYGSHRVSYAMHNGMRSMLELPSQAMVCHGCDNTLCCNPKHLALGTAQSNHKEMITRGRLSSGGRTPLTPDQVRELRALVAPNELEDIKKVAAAMVKFNIHEPAVNKIVCKKAYAWVS